MNGLISRSLPAGALAIVLLFVAVAAMAAGNFAFSPPAGWTVMRSGSNSKWMDPKDVEVVTLHPTTFAGDLSSFASRTLKQGQVSYPSQRVWTNRNYLLCGRHTGRYLIWTANSHGKSMIWEQMVALWGQDGYVVSYVRPTSRAPSSIARGSLLSICGVGSVPEQPGGVPVAPQQPAPGPNQPAPAPAATPQPTPYVYPSLYPRYPPVIPG